MSAISNGRDSTSVSGRSVGGYSSLNRKAVPLKKEEVIPKIRYYERAPLNTRPDLDPDLTQLNSEDAGLPALFSGSTKPFRELPATRRRRRPGGPLHPGTLRNTLYPTVNQFYDQPHPVEAGQVSPMAQFRELCRTLNRQYNLKLLFHLWVAVILVVILYAVLRPLFEKIIRFDLTSLTTFQESLEPLVKIHTEKIV